MSEKITSVDHTIGVLDKLTGVNIETIRYYERIGLLPEAALFPCRGALRSAWKACSAEVAAAQSSIVALRNRVPRRLQDAIGVRVEKILRRAPFAGPGVWCGEPGENFPVREFRA